jgi:hypothetical protein
MTFRDNLSVPFSTVFFDCLTLVTGNDRLSGNVRDYQSALRNVPEGSDVIYVVVKA